MITIITTNLSRRKDAEQMGKALLDNDLIVCSNINKTSSQYYWKGKYHEEKEYQASFKTSIEKKEQAIKYIKKHHPYDVPMILSKNLEINNSYKNWMDKMIG